MSKANDISEKAIDTVPTFGDLKEMRTDWLVLEKERLERKQSPDSDDQLMLDRVKSELSGRGEPSEQTDYTDEGIFPAGDR